MKYIIFTHSGEGAPVAHKLLQEGQDVRLAIAENERMVSTDEELANIKELDEQEQEKEKRRLSLYDGLLEKMPALEAVEMLLKVKNPEEYFLFFDFNYLFRYSEALVGRGFNGNFPTQEDRLLESNREKAKKFVEKFYPKLYVEDHENFKTVEEAKEFLKDTDSVWALKGEDDEAKTIVPDGNDVDKARETILAALDEGREKYEKAGFILERKIINPIEITPQAVFWNGKLLYTNIDIELKKLGNKDVGYMTGCSADLIYLTRPNAKINKIAFPKKVFEMAKEHEGLFVWDASILFDPKNDKPYFGEFCANRVGYNVFYAELSQLPSVTEFFEKVVKGENPFAKIYDTWSASIRLFYLKKDKQGLPVKNVSFSYDASIESNTWLMDARSINNQLKTPGFEESLAVITDIGSTPQEAVKNVYKNIKDFNFQDVYYRTDYIDKSYPGAILRRLDYLKQKGLL